MLLEDNVDFKALTSDPYIKFYRSICSYNANTLLSVFPSLYFTIYAIIIYVFLIT